MSVEMIVGSIRYGTVPPGRGGALAVAQADAEAGQQLERRILEPGLRLCVGLRIHVGPLLDGDHRALRLVEEHGVGEAVAYELPDGVDGFGGERDRLIHRHLAHPVACDGRPGAALLEHAEHARAVLIEGITEPGVAEGATTWLRMKSPERPVMNAIGTPAAAMATRSVTMLRMAMVRVTGLAMGPSTSKRRPRLCTVHSGGSAEWLRLRHNGPMSQPVPAATPLWNPDAPSTVVQGDNLDVLAALPDASFRLIYLDPPFNTGRPQARQHDAPRSAPAGGAGSVIGFKGRSYERIKGDLLSYDDRFEDYWGFLEPRLIEAWRVLADDGTLYLHLDYREAHYAKVLLDALFGRESFLNEIIWAYDYGAKPKNRWPAKHDTILVYVKNPAAYYFDSAAVDREPYMAPGLVTPEKARAGQAPDRCLVAHHRVADRPREDRLSDAEAGGHPAPHRAGVEPRGRLGARLLRGQRHDRRGRRRPRPALPAGRQQPRSDGRDAGAPGGLRARRPLRRLTGHARHRHLDGSSRSLGVRREFPESRVEGWMHYAFEPPPPALPLGCARFCAALFAVVYFVFVRSYIGQVIDERAFAGADAWKGAVIEFAHAFLERAAGRVRRHRGASSRW